MGPPPAAGARPADGCPGSTTVGPMMADRIENLIQFREEPDGRLTIHPWSPDPALRGEEIQHRPALDAEILARIHLDLNLDGPLERDEPTEARVELERRARERLRRVDQ